MESLGRRLDGITDGNIITKSKPDPEVFLKASTFIGEKAECCLVVEDSLAGIEAARRANMMSIAIGDAKSSKSANYNIESFGEIKEIIVALE